MSHHKYLDRAVWGKIHAKAWLDPAFHEQLETDPTAAITAFCKEHGISLDGVRLTKIMARPGDLTDTQLTEIAAGSSSLRMIPNTADFSC